MTDDDYRLKNNYLWLFFIKYYNNTEKGKTWLVVSVK